MRPVDNILIKKLNHSVLFVNCESSIGEELKEFFSFFVPGHKYMPAFKRRVWDGKIKLYNPSTKELPVGLYPYLLQFANKRSYNIEHEDTEYGPPYKENPINLKWIIDFIKSLKLPHEIRDYQFNGIVEAIKRKRAILISPTGSGKSLIIYCLLRWFIKNYDTKVLIIVPTTSLVEQMFNDFKEYSENDNTFDVKKECHVIYSGKPKDNIEQQTVISTWQSIHKLNINWFDQFGMVFGDECHGFKAKSLTSIMHKSREAEYRFGTTGTLDGTQTHELVLQGLFGKIFKVTTTKELQDKDTLAGLDISVIMLNYPKKLKEDFGKRTYQDEIDFIVTYPNRNNFIKNLALGQKGNTLVLFQFVEKHGKVLYDMIKDNADRARKIFYVSGEVHVDDRETIRHITEKQSNAIIVASMGTFSTGINIRNLHNIIFASPSKSQIRVLQSIGRGLRVSDNKTDTKLFDIADDITYEKRINYSYLHSLERIKIYKREKFNYKMHRVDIK